MGWWAARWHGVRVSEDITRQVAERIHTGFGLQLSTLERVTHGADQRARLWLA